MYGIEYDIQYDIECYILIYIYICTYSLLFSIHPRSSHDTCMCIYIYTYTYIYIYTDQYKQYLEQVWQGYPIQIEFAILRLLVQSQIP